jgi:hypothetical protein
MPPPATTAPVSSTAPPPPPSTIVPVDEELATCDAEAMQAAVVYQPNQRMIAGETTTVVAYVHIGSSQLPAGVRNTFPDTEPTTVAPASLACNVEARLVGADFNLTPSDWRGESFLRSATDTVMWEWGVVPNRAGGALPLQLEVRGLLHLANGNDQPTAGKTFSATIVVSAEPEPFWTRVNDFFRQPVVVFVGLAGIIAIIRLLVGLIRLRVRRRRATPPSNPSASEQPARSGARQSPPSSRGE